MIFRKQCPIFEHTFRVWCSLFDHQTQMTLHNERLLTVSVRKFEHRFGEPCPILEHGFGIRDRKSDTAGIPKEDVYCFRTQNRVGVCEIRSPSPGIRAFPTYSPKYGVTFCRCWGFSKNGCGNLLADTERWTIINRSHQEVSIWQCTLIGIRR